MENVVHDRTIRAANADFSVLTALFLAGKIVTINDDFHCKSKKIKLTLLLKMSVPGKNIGCNDPWKNIGRNDPGKNIGRNDPGKKYRA